jgi:hypothetical protein
MYGPFNAISLRAYSWGAKIKGKQTDVAEVIDVQWRTSSRSVGLAVMVTLSFFYVGVKNGLLL